MSYGQPTIYLDHAATTPVDPGVVGVLLPYFTGTFGNPSSIYQLGQEAHAGLDRARQQVARILGARPSEVLFTGGATESNNLALKGVAWAARLAAEEGVTPHIVTTAVEHHAVLHAAEALREQGFGLTIVPCDADGIVSVQAVMAAIRPETCLVSVMYANNEVGSIMPLREMTQAVRERGILMHTDAVQAAGSLSLSVVELGVDLLSLSGHKFYGPKGVGVLYVRRGTAIRFQQDGGGQESGRRGGTENVPLIVGFAEALSRADALRDTLNEHNTMLRDQLWAGIAAGVPDVRLNGPAPGPNRLPNNLNVSFGDVQGETVLLGLDMQGVSASAGSACTTGNSEPSHVLLAMGLTEEEARGSLRFTTGRGNSPEEIDDAIRITAEVVARTRTLASPTRIG